MPLSCFQQPAMRARFIGRGCASLRLAAFALPTLLALRAACAYRARCDRDERPAQRSEEARVEQVELRAVFTERIVFHWLCFLHRGRHGSSVPATAPYLDGCISFCVPCHVVICFSASSLEMP